MTMIKLKIKLDDITVEGNERKHLKTEDPIDTMDIKLSPTTDDQSEKITIVQSSSSGGIGLKKTSTGALLPRGRGSTKRRATSEPADDNYGWFEDFESSPMHLMHDVGTKSHFLQQPLQRSLSLPGSVSTPPFYVLESSLETQQLWYHTAGQRPRQPERERKYFENLWAQNFRNSAVHYDFQVSDGSTSSSELGNQYMDKMPRSEFDCEIVYRGKGSFTHAVSKSFQDVSMTQITMQIPRFRIVKSSNGSIHAEFLNVVSLGNKNAVVLGIWRRHSDYLHLANKVCEVSWFPYTFVALCTVSHLVIMCPYERHGYLSVR
jgi:hypothetical protein